MPVTSSKHVVSDVYIALGNTKFEGQFQRDLLLFRLHLREQFFIRKAHSKLIIGLASAQAQR